MVSWFAIYALFCIILFCMLETKYYLGITLCIALELNSILLCRQMDGLHRVLRSYI
jgi:hypothetical protein